MFVDCASNVRGKSSERQFTAQVDYPWPFVTD
jgi:hypothetical protein